jgi:phosphoethanolamine N-methyltransferase
LHMLGSVEEKQIVELGAGIGRFTGELAKTAKTVLAVDFMATSIEENKRVHSHLKNCSFQVADVTELAVAGGSCDVVFSNWLLMYLSDDEVRALATNMLEWVGDSRHYVYCTRLDA